MNSKRKNTIIRNIAFFGDANVPETDPVYKEAFNVARIVSKQGYTIVDGGGPGVMNAATQGAEAEHGESIAVTFYPTDAPNYEGKYLKNVTDKEIVTSNYIERMFKLMEHSDMFIIFKGGSGTLSEWGTAWVLANIYYGNHKPFILFGEFWIEIIDVIRKNMNIDKNEMAVFEIVTDANEVCPTINRFEKKLDKMKKNKKIQFREGHAYTK